MTGGPFSYKNSCVSVITWWALAYMNKKFSCTSTCHQVMTVDRFKQKHSWRFLRIFLTRVDLLEQSSCGLVNFVVQHFVCSQHLVRSISTGQKACVPFDGKYYPVFKNLGCIMQWHPCIPEDKLPLWLKEHIVTHFIGTEPMETRHFVHLLFHDHFQEPVDRPMIQPSLHIGNTLAVLTPDKGANGCICVDACGMLQGTLQHCNHSFSCDWPLIRVRWHVILTAWFGVSQSMHSLQWLQ